MCKFAQIAWEILNYILMVARTGSVSAAARELDVNRTTVLRHVKRFEKVLGFKVLTRTRKGYALSQQAHKLLEISEQMEVAVNDIEQQYIGAEPGLAARSESRPRIPFMFP